MCIRDRSFTEGAVSSRWSMSLGGSVSRSQQMVHWSIYSEIQGDSKQKSVIEAWLMIRNSITWKSSGWNDIWRWAGNLLTETNFYLPIYWAVLRKTRIMPYIVCGPVTSVVELFKMEHCWWGSKFWRLSWAKISKFFCRGIWKKIIWEITY